MPFISSISILLRPPNEFAGLRRNLNPGLFRPSSLHYPLLHPTGSLCCTTLDCFVIFLLCLNIMTISTCWAPTTAEIRRAFLSYCGAFSFSQFDVTCKHSAVTRVLLVVLTGYIKMYWLCKNVPEGGSNQGEKRKIVGIGDVNSWDCSP